MTSPSPDIQPSPAQKPVGDADIERVQELLSRVARTYAERVVGQEQLRISLVSTLISSGHILLESVPGLAKTTAAQTLAASVSASFHRIQCTPDLMPNDIVGTQILNYQSGEMSTQLGPVHANIVLLDEINRSSAKTQSAMLEAMQERQTSIGGEVFPLPKPFMVLATQNPMACAFTSGTTYRQSSSSGHCLQLLLLFISFWGFPVLLFGFLSRYVITSGGGLPSWVFRVEKNSRMWLSPHRFFPKMLPISTPGTLFNKE